MYFDDAVTLVVPVRDAADAGPARAAALRLVALDRVRPSRGQGSLRVVIRTAQYTFAELAGWRDALADSVLGVVPGVVWLDLDEANNRVSVGLDDGSFDAARGLVVSRLLSLAVPPAAVRFVAERPVQEASAHLGALAAAVPNCGALNSNGCSPVAAGFQIMRQSGHVCTIGFVARYQGVTGFMTGSHCTERKFTVNGDVLYQAQYLPGGPSYRIGFETHDPSGWTCGIYTCRRSDAAFARFDTQTGPGVALPAIPELINLDRPYLFVSGTVGSDGLLYGQEVQKIGRTTGWTYGTITATCTDYVSTQGSEPSFAVQIRCTDRTNAPTQGGDSGGPVFLWDGADRVTLAGVTAANPNGGALYSRFSQIELDFGGPGQFSVVRPPSLSAPVLSGSVVNSRASLSWTPVAGADRYTVTIFAWFTACDDWSCMSYPSPITYATTSGTTFTDNDAGHPVAAVVTPYSFGSEIFYTVVATSDTGMSSSSNLVSFSWVWYQ
jgi:hypothetical protein